MVTRIINVNKSSLKTYFIFIWYKIIVQTPKGSNKDEEVEEDR